MDIAKEYENIANIRERDIATPPAFIEST